jgi:hypothetical protein
MLEVSTDRQRILISQNLVEFPPAGTGERSDAASLATVAMNIAHYGFALSEQAYGALAALDAQALRAWWADVELVLASVTGADKKMESFVVYKNFPQEVLAMSDVEYWTKQILMYWGLPNEWMAQPEQPRAALGEPPTFRVLHLADEDSLRQICDRLLSLPTRWIEQQWADVQFLITVQERPIDLAELPFVENRMRLAAFLMARGARVKVSAATDVLRLAAALSGIDLSLREPGKLRRFARRERVYLLALIERAPNLEEDLARRREQWKRLFHKLHPGDYRQRFPIAVAAYDKLYNATPIPTFNGEVERLLAEPDRACLALLASRPGEMARRLRVLVEIFEADAVRSFLAVIGKLKTLQLLKLERFLATVDARRWRMFPPRGNWGKVQIVEADPKRRAISAKRDLLGAIGAELARRLQKVGPVALAKDAARIKLPTNDAELTPYGRGTEFPIPDAIQFIRTATYWKTGPTQQNLWFDNGWNFHDEDWAPVGVCAWNVQRFGDAAVFSGDPTNSKDLEGRACQMLDLYLPKLVKAKVRYAVWTVLCYSRLTFAKAEEVHAALQWGEKAEEGKLFEPSRCQLSFPLRGDSLAKYVCYLDLKRRTLVYLDANLPARVQSAAANGKLLQRNMPAFVEHLDSLPSVHDLFAHGRLEPDGMPVRYDDADAPVLGGGPAFVFRPTHQRSSFVPFDPTSLL